MTTYMTTARSLTACALLLGTTVLLLPRVVMGQEASPNWGTSTPNPSQPYTGLETRPIKALAPNRVDDLLAGRGAGYALAGELNHYPGPRHVLDLATELQLTPDQDQAARDVLAPMDQQAKLLGSQLVDLEAQLDQAFADGSITDDRLSLLTGQIAQLDGQLRAVHLAAHVKMRAVLTPEQVGRYDRLRGYAAADPESPTPDRQHQPGMHQGTATDQP